MNRSQGSLQRVGGGGGSDGAVGAYAFVQRFPRWRPGAEVGPRHGDRRWSREQSAEDGRGVIERRGQRAAGGEGVEGGLPVEWAVIGGARLTSQVDSQGALLLSRQGCDGVEEVPPVRAQRQGVLLDLKQARRRVRTTPPLQVLSPLGRPAPLDGGVALMLLD